MGVALFFYFLAWLVGFRGQATSLVVILYLIIGYHDDLLILVTGIGTAIVIWAYQSDWLIVGKITGYLNVLGIAFCLIWLVILAFFNFFVIA